MKFTDRREFSYDMDLFGRHDTVTALKIHKDYVVRMSPTKPAPLWMEVDRSKSQFDPLWHVPLDGQLHFSRTFEMPCIVTAERPDWRLTKLGIVPQQKRKFTVDNTLLRELDYFPVRGDLVYFNGYRNMILNVVLEPNGYWNQTNIWLGLVCETIIPPEGDARPLINAGQPAPAEITTRARPLPEA